MEKHKYIRLIEFALANSHFSVNEACEAANISAQEFNFVRESIFSLSNYQSEPFSANETLHWVISPAAYFGYLQHLSYEHAVEEAAKANKRANVALVVSIFVGVFSVVAAIF